MLRDALPFGVDEAAVVGDEQVVETLGKVEGDARLGVAGELPARLTGLHAFDDDSATRLRKLSSASSRAESHCAFDVCKDEASSILTSSKGIAILFSRVG